MTSETEKVATDSENIEQLAKSNCKYCSGRGYERWLSARVRRQDGSIEEQFEQYPCRCILRQVSKVHQAIAR